tara:strand:+ start:469 stop:1269 length:801 start_codon:yes stop_codon:yes gene_type:complete
MNDKIAIIDADSLLYFEMGKPTLEEAIQGIHDRIKDILDKTDCDRYIGFLTKGKCFRYEIAKSKPYKYNRSGSPKPPIYYALLAYVQQAPWNFKSCPGLEADDLVAIAASYYKKTNYVDDFNLIIKKTVICSPDKDVLLQVPGTHYNYQKSEFVTTSHADAEKFLWKQTLMGDSTDGIPGIPGLGPKTADKLIDNIPGVLSPAQAVVQVYVDKFGIVEGVNRFAETFNLVHIIQDLQLASPYIKDDKLFDFELFYRNPTNTEDPWE